MDLNDSMEIRFLDVIVIVAYLAAMVGMAFYFARRNTNTEEYFVGGRSFSGWVIGLSLLGTIVSSQTFLALPAAAYTLDWRQLAVNFPLPVVAILAILVFLPLFRQTRLTSAFEYLGRRYSTFPRIYGTISFIIMQLIRAAQVLFLMSLPIQFVTGLPVELVIILSAIFVGVYTIAGGIDVVIWTDVIQTLVLIFGGLVCLLCIVFMLPHGVSDVFEVASMENKFSLGSFDWDITRRTFWTVLILGVVNWLAIYGGDQNVVQRYASAKSLKEARKAVILFSALALPIWTFFFFVGTSLFAYYSIYPNPAIAGLEADGVLPYFILSRVPSGVAGLLIAAVIAAAMSTMDSSINAIATVSVVDILRPYLAKGRSDAYYLRAAKIIAGLATCLIVVGATVFANMDKESMTDVSLVVTSVFGGCLMSLFMVGFFTRRVDGRSASIALIAAIVWNVYLVLCLLSILPSCTTVEVHSYWIGPLVNLGFIVVAYVLSLLRRTKALELDRLTVWTMRKSL